MESLCVFVITLIMFFFDFNHLFSEEYFFSSLVISFRHKFDVFMFLFRLAGFISHLFLSFNYARSELILVLINGQIYNFVGLPFLIFGLCLVSWVLWKDLGHLRVKSSRSIGHKLVTIFVTANCILSLFLLLYLAFFSSTCRPDIFYLSPICCLFFGLLSFKFNSLHFYS